MNKDVERDMAVLAAEQKRVMDGIQSKFEVTGLKLMITYRCIRCGVFIDDTADAFVHACRCEVEP